MAEKVEKKAEDKPAAPAAGSGDTKKKGGGGASLLKSTPVVLVVVMVMEAAVLLAAFKLLGAGAKPAHADLATSEAVEAGGEGKAAAKNAARKRVEINVLSFKAPNSLRGRTYLYDVSVYAVTPTEKKEEVEKSLKEREATIQDRIRTIIAQTEPERLGGGSEPGLETLRRQVKYQLDEILGEGLVEEVLVPRCIPYRADF